MRASYERAVQWLADNYDGSWLTERGDVPIIVHLVADLWQKTPEQVRRAVRKVVTP